MAGNKSKRDQQQDDMEESDTTINADSDQGVGTAGGTASADYNDSSKMNEDTYGMEENE